jgi:hypothetical protein
VGNPGIPTDDQAGSSYQRSKPAKIKLAGTDAIRAEASGSSHGETTPTFSGRSGNHDAMTGNCQPSGHVCKAADWPAPSLSLGARMHNHRITSRR